MHVLIAHQTKIPVTTYGGTERIMWWLGKHLAESGHEVTFLVNNSTDCHFARVQTYDPHLPLKEQIPSRVDVTHFFFQPRQSLNRPYLVTNQGNVPDREKQLHLDQNTVFVSKNHAVRHGATCFVHNGLDVQSYGEPDLTKNRHCLHFLAKSSWRAKNINGAMAIARQSDWPLEVMGGTRLSSRLSFRNFFNRQARFHGMVDDRRKMEIITQSRGLLFPVVWHEPFGIALLESLYGGSPVFGSTYGALPEIIPQQAGYLSNSYSALVRAIQERSYSPIDCQQHVLQHFTARQMMEKYLQLYALVLGGKPLNETSPSALLTRKEARKLAMNE